MDLLLNESQKEGQRLLNESGLLWLLRSRVKRDGKMENAELGHFASGRSAATKIKGHSIPKQRKAGLGRVPIPTVSVQDPCLPRNSAAIRGLASLFWGPYSQTCKKMATDLRLFLLGYDACRMVNTRWKFRVEERCPAQSPPDHLLDSRTVERYL